MVEGSLYLGETSRSIYEKGLDHKKSWESRSKKSHMLRHQGAAHGGDNPENADFIMRPVRY